MAISKAEVVDYLANMTVLELSTLIKELEEKFGVSAAAPVAMAAMPGMAAAEAPAAAPMRRRWRAECQAPRKLPQGWECVRDGSRTSA